MTNLMMQENIDYLISQYYFDNYLKPQVEAQLRRNQEVQNNLQKFGAFVVIAHNLELKKDKIIFRGTREKCMNIWLDFFQKNIITKRYRVQEIIALQDDNSIVFGNLIIE